MKDNLFNRIFHSKALKAQREKIKDCEQIVENFPKLQKMLKEAKNLEDLIQIHKLAWSKGYQNENLSPCEWGMFRTTSIPTMVPNEIYLGGIYGLLTKPIPFWNKYKDEFFGVNGFGIDTKTKLYSIILSQYNTILFTNFTTIKNQSQKYLDEIRM